jgi:hypothetical protein
MSWDVRDFPDYPGYRPSVILTVLARSRRCVRRAGGPFRESTHYRRLSHEAN